MTRDDQPEPWFSATAENIECEVAGAALHGPPTIDYIRELVNFEDFTFFPTRLVMSTLEQIQDSGGHPGPASVFERLHGSKDFKNLGPQPSVYLFDLHSRAGCGANGQHYARRLREISDRRRLAQLIDSTMTRINETGEPTAAIIEETEEQLFKFNLDSETKRVRNVVPLLEAGYRLTERLNVTNPQPSVYYRTGFESLDNYLGGWRPGRLYILAARPGVGKSALALSFALNASDNGHGSLIFSLEMDADEIVQRAMAIRSGVPLTKIMNATSLGADDYDSMATAKGFGQVYIDDSPTLKASSIGSVTRLAVRKHGVKLVIVDYLQLLTPENHRDPRHLQVGSDTRRLKQLARLCNLPVICLCQLNREIDDTAEPTISQLRDSGEIEQNADVVMLLWREKDDQASSLQRINCKIAKQRAGTTGKLVFHYRRPCVRFEGESYS